MGRGAYPRPSYFYYRVEKTIHEGIGPMNSFFHPGGKNTLYKGKGENHEGKGAYKTEYAQAYEATLEGRAAIAAGDAAGYPGAAASATTGGLQNRVRARFYEKAGEANTR